MSGRGDFWARRKAAVAAEEAREVEAEIARDEAEARAALEEKPDAEILAELNLPDPDQLQPGDDIRGFMAKAVPDRLRRRALRQLWRLNPVLANVDGLVDYGEDFTDSATVVENLQTAYQVGKGMLAHIEAMAREEETPPDPSEETADLSDTPEPAPAADPDAANAEIADAAPPHEPAPENQENQSDTRYDAPRYQPMRFAFDD